LQKKSRQNNARFGLSLKLLFPSEKQAAIAAESARPDLNAGHAKRSASAIGIKNRILSIDIKAEDPAALRASLNSCMNSIMLSKSIMEE